jgi:hypothetical protein
MPTEEYAFPETRVLAVASHVGFTASAFDTWLTISLRLFTGESISSVYLDEDQLKYPKVCREYNGRVYNAVAWLRSSRTQHCPI